MKKIIILVILCCSFWNTNAQSDSTHVNISLNADIVSRYVWRGISYSKSPAIQPTLELSYKNFFIGSWGSYTVAPEPYQEVDLYAGYSVGLFTLSLYDYFQPSEIDSVSTPYFDYSTNNTGHSLEAILETEATDRFPFESTIGVFIWGNDDDDQGENQYSTYIQLAYPFQIQENQLKLFCAITPFQSCYASKFNVVNAGVSVSRSLNINNRYSIPLFGQLGVNPELNTIYFTIGVTL